MSTLRSLVIGILTWITLTTTASEAQTRVPVRLVLIDGVTGQPYRSTAPVPGVCYHNPVAGHVDQVNVSWPASAEGCETVVWLMPDVAYGGFVEGRDGGQMRYVSYQRYAQSAFSLTTGPLGSPQQRLEIPVKRRSRIEGVLRVGRATYDDKSMPRVDLELVVASIGYDKSFRAPFVTLWQGQPPIWRGSSVLGSTTGAFGISGPGDPGDYRLRVLSAAYEFQELAIRLPEDTQRPLRIDLVPRRRVEVTILDPDGRPMPEVWVQFRRKQDPFVDPAELEKLRTEGAQESLLEALARDGEAKGPGHHITGFGRWHRTTVRGDAEGKGLLYETEDFPLKPGRYDVEPGLSSWFAETGWHPVSPVTITADTRTLTVPMRQAPRIRVRVRDSQGRPLSGVSLSIVAEGRPWQPTSTLTTLATDKDGNWSGFMPPRMYQIGSFDLVDTRPVLRVASWEQTVTVEIQGELSEITKAFRHAMEASKPDDVRPVGDPPTVEAMVAGQIRIAGHAEPIPSPGAVFLVDRKAPPRRHAEAELAADGSFITTTLPAAMPAEGAWLVLRTFEKPGSMAWVVSVPAPPEPSGWSTLDVTVPAAVPVRGVWYADPTGVASRAAYEYAGLVLVEVQSGIMIGELGSRYAEAPRGAENPSPAEGEAPPGDWPVEDRAMDFNLAPGRYAVVWMGMSMEEAYRVAEQHEAEQTTDLSLAADHYGVLVGTLDVPLQEPFAWRFPGVREDQRKRLREIIAGVRTP